MVVVTNQIVSVQTHCETENLVQNLVRQPTLFFNEAPKLDMGAERFPTG